VLTLPASGVSVVRTLEADGGEPASPFAPAIPSRRPGPGGARDSDEGGPGVPSRERHAAKAPSAPSVIASAARLAIPVTFIPAPLDYKIHLGPSRLPSPPTMHPCLAATLFAIVPWIAGCSSLPPPASQLPNAAAAIDRLRQTAACGTAIQASAKIDHFGERGRVRGDLMMFAGVPARIRMDLVSGFGVAVATLTSDGTHFALADLRDQRFYVGPANACNIARLTTVPIPGHVLVDLLRGQAPILKHAPDSGTLAWSGRGYYVVTIPSTRTASEELHIAPRPDDLGKPWNEQRLRLLDVRVRQYGEELYHAELGEHASAPMGKERVDLEGGDPPIPPSGPFCDAELPRRIRVDVPDLSEDVRFRYEQVTWNPPLPDGTFTQQPRPGMPVVPQQCE
jgi:hypothetical protein